MIAVSKWIWGCFGVCGARIIVGSIGGIRSIIVRINIGITIRGISDIFKVFWCWGDFWNTDCVLSTSIEIFWVFKYIIIVSSIGDIRRIIVIRIRVISVGGICQKPFLFFGVWGNFEIFIVISQWIWGFWDCRGSDLGGGIFGSGCWRVGDRGITESNFIINCNFWISLFFWWWLRWCENCNCFGDCRSRGSGKSLWDNSGKSVVGRGVVEINFIIKCIFLVVAEVTWKLQFLNEYGELKTVEPGDQEDDFGETLKTVSGVGG